MCYFDEQFLRPSFFNENKFKAHQNMGEKTHDPVHFFPDPVPPGNNERSLSSSPTGFMCTFTRMTKFKQRYLSVYRFSDVREWSIFSVSASVHNQPQFAVPSTVQVRCFFMSYYFVYRTLLQMLWYGCAVDVVNHDPIPDHRPCLYEPGLIGMQMIWDQNSFSFV